MALAAARGGKRSVVLPVSAPFHCRLMAPAAERLAEVLSGVRAADPRTPVVRNVDAELTTRADDVRPVPRPPGHGAGPVDRLRRAHGA